MDFGVFFNVTIGVYWALFFVPDLIRDKKFKLLGFLSIAMLIAQVTISLNYAHREYPYNLFAGVANFCIGMLVGYAMYYFESRKQKDES